MDRKAETEIKEKFRNAMKRLVLLDYDGTLVNHTPIPDSARLPEQMSDIIIKLVDNPRTEIYVITGRSCKDIDRFLNHIPINIIAEHGAIMKTGGVWKDLISDNCLWKKAIMPILNQATITCPESYVEGKNFSLAWHYRNVAHDLGYSSSRKLIHLLNERIHFYDLKILDGNKVVEILSNETGKGSAVKKLFNQNSFDFVLSIGDDATDEEMFEYFFHNSKAFTIKVGEGDTFAKYKLSSISDVESFLKQLSG
jgi:trehalose 6-phosphate synthase/phosphatase